MAGLLFGRGFYSRGASIRAYTVCDGQVQATSVRVCVRVLITYLAACGDNAVLVVTFLSSFFSFPLMLHSNAYMERPGQAWQ